MSDRSLFLKIVCGAALLPLLFTTTAVAQNSTLQPISTRFAQTQTEISLDIMGKRFSDVELDEADQFDGYTAVFDLTVPFAVDKQVRLSVPFYTSGDARLKPGGQPSILKAKVVCSITRLWNLNIKNILPKTWVTIWPIQLALA